MSILDSLFSKHRITPKYAANRVTIIYSTLSVAWILLSDALAANLAGNLATLAEYSLYKGFAFIAVTSVLLYELVFVLATRIDAIARSEAAHKAQLADTDSELSKKNTILTTLLNTLPVGVIMVEARSKSQVKPLKPLVANSAAIKILGRGIEDAIDSGALSNHYFTTNKDTYVPYPSKEMPLSLGLDGKTSHIEDMVVERPNGTSALLEVFGSPILDADNNVIASVVSFTDITVRKATEDRLKLAASVFTYAREGIMITDARGTILDVNESFTRITGYTRNEIIGQDTTILKSGRHPSEFYDSMWSDLIEKGHWYGEISNQRADGEVYVSAQTISSIKDIHGGITNYVSLFADITLLKESEKKLQRLAHYDALTGLPNRVLLADRLRQAMSHAERRNCKLAVAYLDLDGFKYINDEHGHDSGDQVLMAVANRMRLSLREGDTIARIGGDEFAVVMLDVSEVSELDLLVTRLLHAASQHSIIKDQLLKVSASIGITLYPQSSPGVSIEADQLLRQADQAMYQAKQAGKNRYVLFDTANDVVIRDHHESLDRITKAVAQHEFVLYYQPKVNMRTGKVIGAEALIRWQHPSRGLLLPSEFLPTIDGHRLEIDIGEWVLDSALRQLSEWKAAGVVLTMSVNICAKHLQHYGFVEYLTRTLEKYKNIKAGDLDLEILETSALEDLARTSALISACRSLGVVFSLDDFGTGYSSLTYMKRLSVANVKIDQSFVRGMLDDPEDLAILDGVLSLSRAFRRQVIAEGVETIEQGSLLLSLGCDRAQGYVIGKPMTPEDFIDWCRTWRPDAAWSNTNTFSTENTSLIFAKVELLHWFASVESHLFKPSATIPNHSNCRLLPWLSSKEKQHPGDVVLLELQQLHHDSHVLIDELVTYKLSSSERQMKSGLRSLHELRDRMVFLLDSQLV